MYKDNSTQHIYPIKISNPALRNVKTEYKLTESVTRYIAGVPISLSKAGVKLFGRNSKDRIILCDTPGFDDSSGAEVDVANGLGIIRAVEKAKSVKIVLVVGKADLDRRMDGLKNLCYTLSRVLTNYIQQLSCVDIIFTKFSGDNVYQVLQKTFLQALDEMKNKQEDDNDVVVEMFQHIIQLCEKEKIVALDPLDADGRARVLSTLFKDKLRWIQEPDSEFHSFVTAASQSRIIEQIDKIKDSIVKSPTNYDLVDEKLTKVKKLNDILPIKGIVDRVNDCLHTVIKFWNQRLNSAMTAMKGSVEHGSLVQCEKDMIKYKQVLADVNKYEEFYCAHLERKKEDDAPNEFEIAEIKAVSPQELKNTLHSSFSLVLSHCEVFTDDSTGSSNDDDDGHSDEEKKTEKTSQRKPKMMHNELQKVQLILKHFSDHEDKKMSNQ